MIQIQPTKFKPKITRGVKVPCLMPVRVKATFSHSNVVRQSWLKSFIYFNQKAIMKTKKMKLRSRDHRNQLNCTVMKKISSNEKYMTL